MNWYKKAQYEDYSSRHDNYLIQHKREDVVWVFDQNQNLQVEYPNGEGKATHNKAFGLGGKSFIYKGRYNPETGMVTVIENKNFLSTNEKYWKELLEKNLWQEFKNINNIKYY